MIKGESDSPQLRVQQGSGDWLENIATLYLAYHDNNDIVIYQSTVANTKSKANRLLEDTVFTKFDKNTGIDKNCLLPL